MRILLAKTSKLQNFKVFSDLPFEAHENFYKGTVQWLSCNIYIVTNSARVPDNETSVENDREGRFPILGQRYIFRRGDVRVN